MTDEQYEGYMARLDQEYRDYAIGLCKLSPQEIFERVDEIRAVKYANEYLRSTDISHEELEYAMTAMHPLHEIAGQHEAFRCALVQENPVALTVYDIWDKRLFSDGETDLYTGRVPICFHKKVPSIAEILNLPRNREDMSFQIEKVIELNAKDFTTYSNMLLTATPEFISDNTDLMYVDDNKVWHCLLVHNKASHRGILVEADGYYYARYTAYVGNTRELDLTGVPVENYSRTTRGREHKPRQPER